MKHVSRAIRVCFLLQLLTLGVAAQEQQFADIGDLELVNGGVILNLNSECGHLATVCESCQLNEAVAEFLATD
jgi:hypothetical protein